MPKKFFKRYMPDQQTIRDHRSLQFLGTLLHDPNIFHLNRRSVTGAFTVGLFCAFVPIPTQMALAALMAIGSRVNLPISVALVWITNPITMPPMFYFCYKVGAWLLNEPVRTIQFELSLDWLMAELGAIWEPFLFGCFVVGVVSAAAGNISVRIFWRIAVMRSWRSRIQKRRMQVKK